MSTHKYIDRICIFGLVFTILLSALFVSGKALGIQSAQRVMGYENRLFDTGKVHTIDIIMEDWDSFIAACRNEEYAACSLIIDGEAFKNVAIRGKGNTSLSNVASMNSERYSFKVEFDHYDNTKSYHGLDKLSLNNIIQDATFMKDYLTYQLMGSFGAAAPLCSYVYITVNGEDWGLYLAAEGVEDSFLQRNYGSGHGELYKPDSMSFGGGRGNGKDFNMEDFLANRGEAETSAPSTGAQLIRPGGMEGFDPFAMFGSTGDFDPSAMFGGMGNREPAGGAFDRGNMGGRGMGSSDVLLQYTDDDPASYSNIFSSAKTDITEADQTRLIQALKALSEGDAESAVNIEQVIRYFVVHNFVVNGDSYTGSMIHNYYLYEEDGKLEMLPWDYNLAFGTFQGRDAGSAVNDPIDTPLSVTGSGRPIIDWIFAREEYTDLYHQYFGEFLEQTDFAALIDKTVSLIAPYVEKDPTKFYSYAEFEAGAAALREFCLLREQSVQGQLDGMIPSTSDGQRSASAALVEASHVDLSAMGSMGGRGGSMGGNFGGMNGNFGGNRGENAGNGTNGNRGDRWQNSGSGGGAFWPNFPQGNGTSGEFSPGSEDFFGNFPLEAAPGMGENASRFPENITPGNSRVPSIELRPDPLADTAASDTLVLLGSCAFLLPTGLVIAKKYRR